MKFIICIFLFVYSLTVFSQENCDRETIYFTTNGFHSELILPAKDFEFLPEARYGDYLSIGFGDLGFWEADDFDSRTLAEKAKLVGSALLINTPGVMSVSVPHHLPSSIDTIRLTKNDYQKLKKYILDSFSYSEEGDVIPIDSIAVSNLYEASKPYNGVFTCNTWIARALSQTSNFSLGVKPIASTLESKLRKMRYKKLNECQTHISNKNQINFKSF